MEEFFTRQRRTRPATDSKYSARRRAERPASKPPTLTRVVAGGSRLVVDTIGGGALLALATAGDDQLATAGRFGWSGLSGARLAGGK